MAKSHAAEIEGLQVEVRNIKANHSQKHEDDDKRHAELKKEMSDSKVGLTTAINALTKEFHDFRELIKGKMSFVGGMIFAFSLVGALIGAGITFLIQAFKG